MQETIKDVLILKIDSLTLLEIQELNQLRRDLAKQKLPANLKLRLL